MKRFKKKALNQHHKNLNNTTPSPASTAQTKSPANNTHLQTSKPKIKINATADRPPPRYFSMKMFVIVSPPLHPPPLLPQRSQILLMQMITLHPEQHIRHRKQRQCRKQVNSLPSHKRKPTSRRKPRNAQVSYQCLCRPATISNVNLTYFCIINYQV